MAPRGTLGAWLLPPIILCLTSPLVSSWVALPAERLGARPVRGQILGGEAQGLSLRPLPLGRSPHRRRCTPLRCVGEGGGDDAEVSAPTGDWREFRASLISREARLEQQEAPSSEGGNVSNTNGSWAHEIAGAEKGCILLSTMEFPFAQRYFSSAVITIVEHGDEGTLGFITNRPMTQTMGDVAMTQTMGDVAPGLEVFKDSPLMYGGPVGSGVQVLHQVPGVEGSREVIKGLYYGADMEHASRLVVEGKAKPEQFRFFFQYSSWAPGQLNDELEAGTWYPAAASPDLSLLPGRRAIVQTSNVVSDWLMVLGLLGGKFAAMAEQWRKERSIRVGNRLKEWQDAIKTGYVEDGAMILASMGPDWQGFGEDSASRCAVQEELVRMSQRVESLLSQQGIVFGRGGGLPVLKAMNQVIFEEMGFKGNTDNYYDPSNSFINRVLVHRKGNPITLSVVYIALARRLRLTLEGVNAPGHFMVRMREVQEVYYVDVFAEGKIMSEKATMESLQARMPSSEKELPPPEVCLSVAAPVQIWSRMGHNLVRAYLTEGDGDTAVGYNDAMEVLEEAAQAARDEM